MTINYKKYLLSYLFAISTFFSPLVQAISSVTEVISGDVSISSDLISKYAAAYPEIHFINLAGATGYDELKILPLQLGDNARNVDYEHPPEARQLLLDAQMDRIAMMMKGGMPSSTLFMNGNNSTFRQGYTCVITLDEKEFMGDPMSSTRFMAGDAYDARAQINVLDNASFLRFTMSHEIFHCLDAYLNGPPQRQTSSKLKASYYKNRAEQRADLFAALVSMSYSKDANRFIHRLTRYRTFSISDWDIAHYTAPVLKQALALGDEFLLIKNIDKRVAYSMRLADKVVMSFEDYTRFLLLAVNTANTQGIDEVMSLPIVIELFENGYGHLINGEKEQIGQAFLEVESEYF